MSARMMVGAMIVGTVATIALGSRHDAPRAEPRPPVRHEAPWLSREAAAQIIGDGGTLGPLFDQVVIGGPAPSSEIRDRIAAFARDNHVAIDLDVSDGELVAIRFDVTFPGGGGYQGADVLALRLGRPSTGVCCVCGPDTWVDDWANMSDDGVYMRGRIRVNRVTARWERAAELPELIERADALVGMTMEAARAAAGDHWIDRELGRSAMIELPYPFAHADWGIAVPRTGFRGFSDFGLQLELAHGRVAGVELSFRDFEDAHDAELAAILRRRWGRGRPTGEDGERTWRTRGRVITASLGGSYADIAIRDPGARATPSATP